MHRRIACLNVGPHHLSKRLTETLDGLLAGESAKEIAARLDLSQHTIHNYIKAVYREYQVSSRGELLSLFIALPNRDGRRLARQEVLQ
ncbi:MAG TPA: LuxR C-terminal-related transcriptional regulator [Tepidisphaeraceae bacterium]|nr:LuxR C-terminal-related transcriptional regulator [Tepidisphaeraceae bacterium]